MVTDSLFAEAKKWFMTKFSPYQRRQERNWYKFVSLFRQRYCVVPDRLKVQVECNTAFTEEEAPEKSIHVLVNRIEVLEGTVNQLQGTVTRQKQVIEQLQFIVGDQGEQLYLVSQKNQVQQGGHDKSITG